MKAIVLDTSAIINMVRNTAQGNACFTLLESSYSSSSFVASIVTKAEIETFVKRNNWGENKLKRLQLFLDQIFYLDITNTKDDLIHCYTTIDNYSKRHLVDNNGNLLLGSARKMGKNDLWIAATALCLDLPLLTTDTDFDHLKDSFINLIRV